MLLDIAIAGMGSSGLFAAYALLQSEAPIRSIRLYEATSGQSSIPSRFPNIRSITPAKDLLPLLYEDQNLASLIYAFSERVPDREAYVPLVKLRRLEIALKNTLPRMAQEKNIVLSYSYNAPITELREVTASGNIPIYTIGHRNARYQEANVVVLAQGSTEKTLPMQLLARIGNNAQVSLQELHAKPKDLQKQRFVVIGGGTTAGVSAAGATVQTLVQGAEHVIVAHNNTNLLADESPFHMYKEQRKNGVRIQHRPYSSLRGPLADLMEQALKTASNRVSFLPSEKLSELPGYTIINATGWRPNPIMYLDQLGHLLTRTVNRELDHPPHVIKPGGEPFLTVYGIGMGWAWKYVPNTKPNTLIHEKKGVPAPGVAHTYRQCRAIATDVEHIPI